MKYIEQLRDGMHVCDVYLCKQRTTAVTKTGKPYDSMILQDRTGLIDAKIWEPGSPGIQDCDALDYIEVTGDVSLFAGQLQLSVKRLRRVSEGEYDPGDYMPKSCYSIDDMWSKFTEYGNSVENKYLKKLLHVLIFDNEEVCKIFKNHSAAKSVHHGFIGGLLEHSLSVTTNCDFFAKRYSILNRDLLITAAMIHDIGKIQELSDFPLNDYTDEGNLLGHIVMGSEMITEASKTIPDFPPVLLNELKHCILAHHGELEFGSPKKPMLVEALALSFADNIDAKMETFKEVLNSTQNDGNEWLGFNRLFDSNIRKTTV